MPTEQPTSPSPGEQARAPRDRSPSGIVRYWELRRIWYNLALAALVVAWVVRTWPHFRPVLDLGSLGKLLVLALIANLCYSTAYVVDLTLLASLDAPARRRWRGVLWLAGTLFALLVATYWIGDEIYPSVNDA